MPQVNLVRTKEQAHFSQLPYWGRRSGPIRFKAPIEPSKLNQPHGCSGILPLFHERTNRLQAWGYVALVLDSFGPRGIDSVSKELDVGAGNIRVRSFDADGAHKFLSTLDFVDSQHIGLVSHYMDGHDKEVDNGNQG